MDGFFKFLKEQGIAGLAIGFILGGSIDEVVRSLVEDVVEPLLSRVIGSPEGLAKFAIGDIAYGAFLVTLIDFVILAFIVYFGSRLIHRETKTKKKT